MAVIVSADDDASVRHVITRVLEQAGHTVIAVNDGAAAITETRARHPDLVLLDGEMPGMDGFEACTALHEDPATSMIPVMMVTGSMPPAQVIRRVPHVRHVLGLPSGPDVTKPVSSNVRPGMPRPWSYTARVAYSTRPTATGSPGGNAG